MPAVKSQDDQLREIMMAAQPSSGYQNTARMLSQRRQPVRHWAQALGNFATGLSSHLNSQAAAQAEQQQALAKQRLAQMNRRDPIADYRAKLQIEQDVRSQQLDKMRDQLSPYEAAVFDATGNLPGRQAQKPPEIFKMDGRLVDATGRVVYEAPDAQQGAGPGGKIPTGYRWNPQKQRAEPIPGAGKDEFGGEQAARIGLMVNTLRNFPRIEEISKNMGSVVNPATSAAFAMNYGEIGEMKRSIEEGVEGILRSLTGAAANASEVQSNSQRYTPLPSDSAATRQKKLTAFKRVMQVMIGVQSGRIDKQAAQSMLDKEGFKFDDPVVTQDQINALKSRYGLE